MIQKAGSIGRLVAWIVIACAIGGFASCTETGPRDRDADSQALDTGWGSEKGKRLRDSMRREYLRRARQKPETGPRPATTIDTLTVEGDELLVEMKLISTDLYSTYYPADELVAANVSSGEGTGVTFVANFDGERNDSAFLHIFHPAMATAGPNVMHEMLVAKRGVARSRGWTLMEEKASYPWALESYSINAPGGIVGFACIGEYRGRGFIITAAYPLEYGDGMGARISRILHHFRWSDSGLRLGDDPPLNVPLD